MSLFFWGHFLGVWPFFGSMLNLNKTTKIKMSLFYNMWYGQRDRYTTLNDSYKNCFGTMFNLASLRRLKNCMNTLEIGNKLWNHKTYMKQPKAMRWTVECQLFTLINLQSSIRITSMRQNPWSEITNGKWLKMTLRKCSMEQESVKNLSCLPFDQRKPI
jgi:hypothetical protein